MVHDHVCAVLNYCVSIIELLSTHTHTHTHTHRYYLRAVHDVNQVKNQAKPLKASSWLLSQSWWPEVSASTLPVWKNLGVCVCDVCVCVCDDCVCVMICVCVCVCVWCVRDNIFNWCLLRIYLCGWILVFDVCVCVCDELCVCAEQFNDRNTIV